MAEVNILQQFYYCIYHLCALGWTSRHKRKELNPYSYPIPHGSSLKQVYVSRLMVCAVNIRLQFQTQQTE